MKRARIALATICLFAGIGGALAGAYANKARAFTYYYFTTTTGGAATTLQTTVAAACSGASLPCTTLINDEVETLYKPNGTAYVTIFRP